MLEIAIGAIIVALIFDFVNGFNDSANSVATVIGTRVLKPIHAVALSASMNFIGPFVFGVAVATTIAKGIVSPDDITVYMIVGGLAGAIGWSTLCTYFGLPISNSHSLVGGIMGAGIMGLGFEKLVFGGLTKVFAGIVIAPIGGIIFGLLLTGLIITIFASRRPAPVNKTFGKLQIISSAWFALTHGANDGQKTMGIIVLILFSAGMIRTRNASLGNFCCSNCNGIGYFLWRIQSYQNTWCKNYKTKAISRICSRNWWRFDACSICNIWNSCKYYSCYHRHNYGCRCCQTKTSCTLEGK